MRTTQRPRVYAAGLNELAGPPSFAAVLAQKCSIGGDFFRIYAMPNGGEVARLGIVVSKKTVHQAVQRNYCKRLVREAFRSESPALAGTDVVVRVRTTVRRAQSQKARTELRKLLFRAQQLCCPDAA